jgi:hypothetical protein
MTSNLNTIEQLTRVIEAQVKCGRTLWDVIPSQIIMITQAGVLGKDDGEEYHIHILEILLDPEGVRAIWGEKSDAVASAITHAWLSGRAEQAISIAFQMLP